MRKRTLVCGGRDYRDYAAVTAALDMLEPTSVVHGAATGADSLGGRYAQEKGLPMKAYAPSRKLDGPGWDWKFRRNERMLHRAKPDLVVAFPGGNGTKHMVETARKHGYLVWDLRRGDHPKEVPQEIRAGLEALELRRQRAAAAEEEAPGPQPQAPAPNGTAEPKQAAMKLGDETPASPEDRTVQVAGRNFTEIRSGERTLRIPETMGPTKVGTVAQKSLLMPGQGFIQTFDWVINPYTGCSFGCDYCYASNFTQREGEGLDWGKWVKVKTNASEQAAALKAGSLTGKTVYMATVTDPYQPVEKHAEVSRDILKALAENQPGVKLVIQTRGTLVTRDLDLFQQIEARGGRVQVNMTITTDDDEVRKIYEPGCSSVETRIKATTELQAAGIQTCVTMTPMLPVKDAGKLAQDLMDQGVMRFIIQAFHTKGSGKEMIARTDQRAIDSTMRHYATDSEPEALKRYNANYITAARAMRDLARERKEMVLGEGKEGFKPPF